MTLLVPTLLRFAAGWPKKLDGDPKDRAPYAPLEGALTGEFPDDRHFCAYSVPEIPRRLGMNRERKGSGLTLWDRMPDSGIPMVVFAVDADAKLAGHKMTPEWWAGERRKVERLFSAVPGFCYTTRGGYRLVWLEPEPFVIREPLDAARWSALYLARLDHLRQRYQIIGDRACKDFPRHYRLPYVMRDRAGGSVEATKASTVTIGDPGAVSYWTTPVQVPPVRVPKVDVDAPEPSWGTDPVNLGECRSSLRAYVRRKRQSKDRGDMSRADLIERVVEGRALTDSIGQAGIGRWDTVNQAAYILGRVVPDVGPEIAVEIMRTSIAAMDCDSEGGKGRDTYLDEVRESYTAAVAEVLRDRERNRQLCEGVRDAAEAFKRRALR